MESGFIAALYHSFAEVAVKSQPDESVDDSLIVGVEPLPCTAFGVVSRSPNAGAPIEAREKAYVCPAVKSGICEPSFPRVLEVLIDELCSFRVESNFDFGLQLHEGRSVDDVLCLLSQLA